MDFSYTCCASRCPTVEWDAVGVHPIAFARFDGFASVNGGYAFLVIGIIEFGKAR